VIFIASLFVVGEALDATGVTAWIGQELIERGGESRSRVLVLMLLLVAGLTALIGGRRPARDRDDRDRRPLSVSASCRSGRCAR
jgi:hypothetical protein